MGQHYYLSGNYDILVNGQPAGRIEIRVLLDVFGPPRESNALAFVCEDYQGHIPSR